MPPEKLPYIVPVVAEICTKNVETHRWEEGTTIQGKPKSFTEFAHT